MQKTFEELFAEIKEKSISRTQNSRTVLELDQGLHFIGKKLVEEAAESWMAAEYQSKAEAAEELSQLIYHIQVMMVALDLELEDIYRYL